MRSIKGIIIGFLLILLGFAVTSYSLIAGGVLAAAGLAAVVIFALPKKTQQPQAEQPPAPAPEPEDPAPELQPEALPDILTDPPAQKKPEPPPAADAQTLFGTLAEAYTRIDELTCRGPAWMLERDIRLCRAFCERWEAAVKDPVFASFVRAKARYADYTDEFLLPGFGKRGRIHGRRTSGELLDDLTAAVKKRASRQESALQSALRAEQWFESICRQLRRVQPAVQEGAAGEAVQGPLPQPSALRADTPLQTLDTFCVLALKTTGKHPGRDELVQLSDCAFVGDSICSGLFVYDVLPKDMVVATGNVGIRSLREYTFDINGGTYTALEALKVIDPKYVIFSMGMNDINMTSEETYCQNYLSFLADTQAELPSAKLYVASITPIDAGSNFASNDKIDRYNAAAKAAVEQAGYGFIDVTTHLRNDTGGLNPDCGGGDGIHVNKLGYYSMLTDVAKRLVADRH